MSAVAPEPASTPTTEEGDGKRHLVVVSTPTSMDNAARWKHWYEWFPLVNLGYEFLFDEPPSFEALEKTLNLLGLVDALLLTIAVAIPTSFDDEEIERVNEKFASGGEWKFFNEHLKAADELGGLYSNRLLMNWSHAINSLSVSFISVILTYVILANTFIVENPVIMRAWWKYVRWVITAQIFFTTMGFVYTGFVGLVSVEMKYPDPHIREHGEHGGMDAFFSNLSSHDRPWARNWTSLVLSASVAVCGTALTLSLATANRHWRRYNPEAKDSVLGMGIFLPSPPRGCFVR